MAVGIDPLVNQAAKLRYMSGGQAKLPLVIFTQCGAGTSEAAQHSQCLEAWFAHVPGLKVVMPATVADAKGLLKASIRDDNPVVYIWHKLLYDLKEEVPDGEFVTPLGKAAIRREGTDVTLVATSLMVHRALAAAEVLAGEVSIELIDLRTSCRGTSRPCWLRLKRPGGCWWFTRPIPSSASGPRLSAE